MNSPNNNERVTYFAETDFRNKKTRFGIKPKDRTRHMYIIGKTGVGKSTLIENMVIQDIQNGEGVALIDPHGGTAEKMLDYVPEDRINDVIYFAPFDTDYPISFNVLEDIGEDKRHLVVSGLMSVFKKIWQDAWSARMEYILNNTLLALLEYPGSTLMGVNKMLSDKEFRKKIVDNVKDPAVKSFWVDEYAKYTEKFAAEATPAIQNKIGQYTLNPLIRNIIGQPKSSFDIREIMDKKKIFIVNLSKGRIGEQNMNLLGGMFVTKIYLAAMSRAELQEKEIEALPPFYLYVDEFQNFANESFAQILSEARKYKLCLTVANQYVTQMVEEVRDAILGNVGTMVTFRIGPSDAEIFEKEFSPTFTAEDLANLGFAQTYLRLMIDGMTSKPFSATTIAPIPRAQTTFKEQIIAASRANYAKPRAEVEGDIKTWHDEISAKPPVEKKEGYQPRPATDGGMRKPFEQKFHNVVPQSRVLYSGIGERKEAPSAPRPQSTHIPSVPLRTTPTPVVSPSPASVITPTSPALVTRPTSSPIASAPKPYVAPERKIEPKKFEPRPAPVRQDPSPKLKDLLMQLEKTEERTQEHKNTQTSNVEQKIQPKQQEIKVIPEEKKVEPVRVQTSQHEQPQQPISLSSLSHGSKKNPTAEKKAELKALLSRVLQKKEPEVQEHKNIETSNRVHGTREHTNTEQKTQNKTQEKNESYTSGTQSKQEETVSTDEEKVKNNPTIDKGVSTKKEIPEHVLRAILSE